MAGEDLLLDKKLAIESFAKLPDKVSADVSIERILIYLADNEAATPHEPFMREFAE